MEQSESNDSSSCYEFDAPSQVIDFKALDNADNADHWFEKRGSAEASHHLTPLTLPLRGVDKANLPRAVVNPSVKTAVDAAPVPASSPPSNVVTSWGERPTTQMAVQRRMDARPKRKTNTQPIRVSKRKTVGGQEGTEMSTPPVKKQKRSVTRPARLSGANRRRNSRTAAANNPPQPISSETLELARIRNLQKEVAEHRRKNEASYKAALAGNAPPKKLVLSSTVPKEFHFSTDTRIKASTLSNAGQKEVDFKAQLRKHPSSPAKAPKGATVPKPFNLSTGHKRKAEEPAAYVPMAQQIEQFQKRIPDRYHLRSRQSIQRGPSPLRGEQLKITQPHTPQLMTRQRIRSTNIKSQAELEAEQVEEQQKFKFKALELNKKILESAQNPKKPAVKEPTKPEGFELQVEKRLQERQATKPHQPKEQLNTFHPRPLPTRILEEVVGVPEKRAIHPTVPESPAFALKKRVRIERKEEEVKPPSPVKAHPVPHFGLPFRPRLPEKSQVEVCPFSFEERERERRALKEKRLDEIRNEEVPKFKAQPLPDFHEVVLPEKKVIEPTKPEPFKLVLDERGTVKNDRWEQMVKEEQKRQAAGALFKARPNTVIYKEPFQPKKEIRTIPVPEAFELSTERRAKERQQYEKEVSEKEALRARIEEARRLEEEERKKEEIAQLRQEQVHKAQPIRRYKPAELKKSDIALTLPQSPNFSDRFRL